MKEIIKYFEGFENQQITFIIDGIDRLKYTARTLSQYRNLIKETDTDNKYFPNTERHHVYKQIYPSTNLQINVCVAAKSYEEAEHGFLNFEEYINYYG